MPDKGENLKPELQEAFVLQAESCQCAPFREKLRGLLIKMAFDEKTTGEIVLSADEALTNIIRHAYEGKPGRIDIEVSGFENRLELVFKDSGRKFDPTSIPEPELPPKKGGGLGVYFMKQLMDKVEYDAAFAKGNRLVLTKFRNPR